MVVRRYWLGRWILHYLNTTSLIQDFVGFFRNGFWTFTGFGLKKGRFSGSGFFRLSLDIIYYLFF